MASQSYEQINIQSNIQSMVLQRVKHFLSLFAMFIDFSILVSAFAWFSFLPEV